MKEIVLGDYTLVLDNAYYMIYLVYLHDKKIGWVWFNQDMSLLTLRTDDTDLITLLLLRYQPGPEFTISPYEIILGESSFLMICHYIDQMTYR